MSGTPDLIFDLGMHKGEDAAFYLAKGFRVVGVEASAELCTSVEDRLGAYVRSGQLTIVNAAIAAEDGPVDFFVNPNSVWGTTQPEWADRNERLGSATSETITVDGIRCERLLETHGIPRYMKIDVEGADTQCLEALRSVEGRPAFVSIESEKRSWAALRREFDLFTELGYHGFKAVPQHRVPMQVPPDPPREGRWVAHEFEGGSSGLFGDELPGEWVSRRRVTAEYAAIFARYKTFGDDGLLVTKGANLLSRAYHRFGGFVGWYDTHAALGHPASS